MKRFTQQFHKQSESVKIQAAEKRELRERVVSYMEYHPMPASLAQSVRPVKSLSISPYGMVQIPFSIVFKWSAVATVFLLVVLPVMAERSVPGDNLYAVKVRFSEEVRSTLTLTSYAKVEWETERINRRVAEARLLASEGRLTSEVEVEIAAAVKEHTEMVQHEIDELRESDVDQATLASIELSTTLELQSASLQDDGNATLALAISDVASGNSTQLVVDVINESLSANESQVESAGIPAYDKIMARVEINTTRAYELLASLSITPDDQLRADISRRLEDIGRSIEIAKTMRGADEVVASEYLVDVLQRTQKLVVYMSDIDGNRSVALDIFVPIVFTEEEQKQQLAVVSAEVYRKQEILKTVKEKLSPAVAEKIAYSLDVAANNIATIASSTETTRSLYLAKESDALLTDSLLLVKTDGIDITVAVTGAGETSVNATTTTNSISPDEGTDEVME